MRYLESDSKLYPVNGFAPRLVPGSMPRTNSKMSTSSRENSLLSVDPCYRILLTPFQRGNVMADMVKTDAMNVIHTNAAGLDVHKMQITATVRLSRPDQEAEQITNTFSTLPSGLAQLTNWLHQHKVTAAVMEATGVYWEIVFDALDSVGIEPILVHAQHVKQLKGRKTDVADSIWLARICQFGLCSPSFVPPTEFRELRKLSRQRRKVVHHRATLRTRIHQTLDSAGIRIGGLLSDLFGVNGQRILKGLVAGQTRDEIIAGLSSHVRHRVEQLYDALDAKLTVHARFILQDQLDAFAAAEARVARYDAFIRDRLAPWEEQVQLLTTIPGISEDSARAILIELGPDIRAFASVRHCAAWAGLCPGNNESAGKRRSGRARKGNSCLRCVLVECAHGAARTADCQFEGYHKALTIRRGYKRAIVATAHKMLRCIYAMLLKGTAYQDPEADYEALMVRRNAPRWIAMLKKYGMSPANLSCSMLKAA